MLLQWRDASAPRFGRAAARLPKALDPDNCGAGTNRKFLGRLAPRSSTFDLRNHSLPHLPRIGLWHRPASQKRINADSLSHPRPHENPPDSIGAEHALVSMCPIKEAARPEANISELETVAGTSTGAKPMTSTQYATNMARAFMAAEVVMAAANCGGSIDARARAEKLLDDYFALVEQAVSWIED